MSGQTSAEALQLAKEIDAICDQFESEWQSGSRPDLAHFLSKETCYPTETLLLELIQIDMDYRQKQGETPDAREYASMFPEFSDTILKLSTAADIHTEIQKVEESGPVAGDFKKFGRYELHQELGRGGFGVVWKAWDQTLARWVAIKIARVSDSGSIRQLFRKEARAMASMNHPNVVRVIDFDIENDLAYIVFELIDGKNLSSIYRERKFSVDQIIELAIQIAAGLEHVHEQGVIHRDLKPANILLTEHDKVVIADFGLARQVDTQSTIAEPGQVFGTVPFMSPEQLMGKSVDARTDLYALGVIMYRMLTGELPFDGSKAEMRHKILNERAKPPREFSQDVSESLSAICLKALAKNPEHRFQSAREFRTHLEQLLAGETVVVPITTDESESESAPAKLDRRSLLIAGGTLGFVGVTGIAAKLFFADSTYTNPTDTDPRMTVPVPEPPRTDITVPVRITTTPPGANLVLHPIDYDTGQPQPENRIVIDEVSPVDRDLAPGDYLIVAYFDDGRFNEAYRHVFAPGESMFVSSPRSRRGEDGRLLFHSIGIPNLDITENMVLVSGQMRFPVPRYYDHEKNRTFLIPDFYVDQYEFTQGERAALMGGKITEEQKNIWRLDGEDYPLRRPNDFDRMVDFAEQNGKRLLTEIEYYYVATNAGMTKYPWGNEMHPDAVNVGSELQEVGQPAFDQTLHDPPIYGLCSGIAEWVDSQLLVKPPDGENAVILPFERNRYAVKGGGESVILGDFRVTEETRNPRTTEYRDKVSGLPGIGVRFGRSAKPRLLPKDFLQVADFVE